MKKKYVALVILITAVVVFTLGVLSNKTNLKSKTGVANFKAGRLLEVGSNSCASCQAMNKVLESLKTNHPERVVVEKIDIFKQKEAMTKLDVRVIPTQIFYDKNQNEIFRHEGFISEKDILAKLDELGI